MKEFFKIQLVMKGGSRSAFRLAVFLLNTLSLFSALSLSAVSAFAQSESSVVEIKIGKEIRKLYSLSALPERVSIPMLSSTGEVTSFSEQQVISVTDKRDLFGVVIPTDGGFFGTIVDQSKSNPVYYQLSPKVRTITAGATKRSAIIAQEVTELNSHDLSLPTHCGDHGDAPKLASRTAKMVSGLTAQSSWRELELFVVSSSEFSSTRSEESITAQILSTVAAANLFFEPLELKITLSGIQIIRADNDPYADALKKLDADAMLSVVRAQWSGKSDVKRDVVAVFGTSNYNRYSISNTVSSTDIFGLAYTGTACSNQDYSVLFASQGTLDSKGELSLAATLAHELGHTLGMSHDRELYGQVPSLMYPTFTLNPGGFSDASTKQYLTYTAPGLAGGACLSSIPAPVSIAFEGGASETISIKEGEKFSRAIKVSGTSATVSATLLSAGATFNDTTSEFTFQPSFDLANKKTRTKVVTHKLVAKLLDGREITKELVFKVTDVNRAPVIQLVKVSRGLKGVKVAFSVTDPDGDKLKIAKSTLKLVGGLSGRRNFRFDGKRVTFTWIPQTTYKGVPLSYRITDIGGLSSTVNVRALPKDF